MAAPLLSLTAIDLTFGGTPLLTGAELSVAPGERICLVGRNGSGKSTLLKIAAGLLEADRGERFTQPGARIAYLAQEPDMSAHPSVLAFVEAAFPAEADSYRARLMLGELGIDPALSPRHLSGGEVRRASIAHALAPSPDILLLDEPTNHLDLPAIEWLERELGGLSAAIVVISHDRRFLEALTRTTVWLDRGVTRRLDQGFAGFEAWRDEVLEREELEAHKLQRRIVREEQWLHGGVTARRKRNVRRVAELAGLRRRRREARASEGSVRMEASDADASGKLVVEATAVSKAFDGMPIVRDLTLRVARGDRLGLVGPNGAGKTTLIKLLTGEIEPDAGGVRQGAGLHIAALDQQREALDPRVTLTEALTRGRGDTVVVNGQPRHVASYMKDFLFKPEQARTPLGVLSGGERARLMLARALSQPSNLLVLDEPTNDLDLETLDLLQELVADYAGTVLLVSHDRDFLDRTVTGVLAAEGDGRWTEYAGGYSDMIAQRRGERLPARASGGAKADAAPQAAGIGGRAARAAGAPRRKLSFKEKHALAVLPERITALEAEIAQLATLLADPALYVRDPERFGRSSRRLGDAQAELAAAEQQWLELELLRETLEG